VPDDLVESLIRGSHALVRPKVPRARVHEAESGS
jgi:predicted DNA-binding protein (MmcQ/YjbR family)